MSSEPSSDIRKLAVIDSRIVQRPFLFEIGRGASSVTNQPFQAVTSSSSQQLFNVFVPSEQTFIDREILWTCGVNMQMTVNTPTLTSGQPIVVCGRDYAVTSFPLASLVNTTQVTVNNVQTSLNTSDVLQPLLRMSDMKRNRMHRTCPTMLDTYQNYNDGYGTLNTPLGGYDAAKDYDSVPNGAFPWLYYTDNLGTRLTSPGNAAVPAFPGAPYAQINGIPVAPAQWTAAAPYPANSLVQTDGNAYYTSAGASIAQNPAAGAPWQLVQVLNATNVPIYFNFISTEPVVCSPFIWNDSHEFGECGLFGVTQLQVLFNFSSANASRLVRSTARGGRTIRNIALNSTASPFVSPTLNVQFLSPNLSVPLPEKSMVPWGDYPRYIFSQPGGTAIAPGAVAMISSQTIVLSAIPQKFIIYARPSVVGPNDGDWYLPLASVADGVRAPVSFNWQNWSGLLSTMTTEELFRLSKHNGLEEMDFATWSGSAPSAAGGYTYTPIAADPADPAYTRVQGQAVPTSGSILVLNCGQDLILAEGDAAGCVGSYVFQFNIQYKNTSNVAQVPQLYVIPISFGVMETIKGASQVVRAPITQKDVIDAQQSPMALRADLNRVVGGAKSLGQVLNRVREVYHHVRSKLPQRLHEGLDLARHIGQDLGLGGSGRTGGGGGRTGGKKSLASRLM